MKLRHTCLPCRYWRSPRSPWPMRRPRSTASSRPPAKRTARWSTSTTCPTGSAPRLTSSDGLQNACEWARDRFKSFGIENARLEKWGEFPVGFNRGPWSGRMVEPTVEGPDVRHQLVDRRHQGRRQGQGRPGPENEEELDKVKDKLAGRLGPGRPPAAGAGAAGGGGRRRVPQEARRRLRRGQDRRHRPRARGRPDPHRRQLPDLLGQAARRARRSTWSRSSSTRSPRWLKDGKPVVARVRHPQLLQEGPDPALQRDRRHPRAPSSPTST